MPLICGRVDDMPASEISGSARSRCRRCGADVWIAPSAWPWVKVGLPIECVVCAVRDLATSGPRSPG